VSGQQKSEVIVSEVNYFSIGEFARRVGVTVRPLRYDDQAGLLKPSAYTESGRRLYAETDYARIQQILTLKLIGLSLDEIQSVLTSDRAEMCDLLERQKRVLGQQMRQLEGVIRAIEQAQATLNDSPAWDMEQFIQIIKAVMMSTQTDWFGQFFSSEQRGKLAETSIRQPFSEQKRLAEAWKQLFADIREQIREDGDAAVAHALVARWDDLMTQITIDDPSLASQLTQAYAHLDTFPGLDDAPPPLQEWLAELQEAVRFIEQARGK
jgi:DNA-binding transcriptional MerR regulator